MRMGGMIAGDIRFQWKYGFYLIYALLSILYICLLSAFPAGWRENAAYIMIFSDPAAMGLFFMGAIVLMEKNERVLNALAVSPIRKWEYILSKAIALCLISALVALVLGFVAGVENLPMVVVGTALTSVLFTLIGIIAAAKIKTMNQYFMVILPVDILCFAPPVIGLFVDLPAPLQYYPCNAAMALLTGGGSFAANLTAVVAAILILYFLAHRTVTKMWKSAGGASI